MKSREELGWPRLCHRKGCTLGWERGTRAITQRNNMAALEDKAIWEGGEVFFTFMAVSKSFFNHLDRLENI